MIRSARGRRTDWTDSAALGAVARFSLTSSTTKLPFSSSTLPCNCSKSTTARLNSAEPLRSSQSSLALLSASSNTQTALPRHTNHPIYRSQLLHHRSTRAFELTGMTRTGGEGQGWAGAFGARSSQLQGRQGLPQMLEARLTRSTGLQREGEHVRKDGQSGSREGLGRRVSKPRERCKV